MKNFIFLIILIIFFFNSCVNNQKNKLESKISYDPRGFFLEPYIVRFNNGIYQLTGINKENTIGILNGKGEIALLSFDENMNPKEKVIAKGFPGYTEGDLELLSDPEHSLLWLRRGSGVYFADPETGKTGHSISMLPGSKVFQVFLANPDEKKWWIIYGVSNYAVDEYNINTNTKTTFDITLRGLLWPFGKNRFLLNSTNFDENYKWRFVDNKFNLLHPLKKNQLTKAMNNAHDFYLTHNRKEYSTKTNIIITSTMTTDYSVYWDISKNDDEENVVISPFSVLQQPGDIQALGEILQFSTDGKWFDMSARYKPNRKIEPPVERILYYVDRSFPASVSSPIRLNCPHYIAIDPIADLLDGTFMQHNTWGSCYVMQDGHNTLKIFKLNDGLELIQKLQQNTE